MKALRSNMRKRVKNMKWEYRAKINTSRFYYEFLKALNGGKQMRDVWSFPAIAPWEKSCGKHPTQKPLALLVRLLLMSSNENSLICDPFSGSSTTGIVANLLNRKFVGIEQESEFIEISVKRKKELEHYTESIESKIKDLAFYKKTLL